MQFELNVQLSLHQKDDNKHLTMEKTNKQNYKLSIALNLRRQPEFLWSKHQIFIYELGSKVYQNTNCQPAAMKSPAHSQIRVSHFRFVSHCATKL